MSRTPKIEIHGVSSTGEHYILNHLTADNSEVQGNRDPQVALERLKEQAKNMAGRWQHHFPHDQIKVVEA